MAVKMEGASPPVFEQIFRNARFAQGGNALFEGKVAGAPKPQVIWTRQGLQMKGTEKHQMMYDEVSGSVSLLIKAIGPGDEGEYTCTALNPYGEAICTVFISPEATKAVKKSRSSHKLLKSKSGHDQQMLAQQQQQQQQQQVAVQPQQQQISQQQKSVQQQSFQQSSSSVQQSSSSMQQSSSSSMMQSSQQASNVQQASSFQQSAGFQQSSSSSLQQSNVQQSSVQQSNVQQSSVQQSSLQQSSLQQSSLQQSSMQQASSIQQSNMQQSGSSNFQQSAISSSNLSQQGQGMLKEAEPETIYLKHVERQQAQQRKEETSVKYPPPQFMTPLMNVNITEGQRAHFEAKVGPVGDPSMVVEWYFNGAMIQASSRVNTTCQFGFITMDMLNCTAEDAGDYTCVIKSESGHDRSDCTLFVNQRKEIESEMHSSSLKVVESQQQQQQLLIQEESIPAPSFTRQLQNVGEKTEGSSVKLEAQVNPSSDSSMKIEWYKDGQPITASSRIGSIFSFGYVSLTISDLRVEDSGTYICRAINKSGEDRSQTSFTVKASQSMTAFTGLEEQKAYIQKTEQLEMYQASKMSKTEMVMDQSSQAPEFKTNIKDQLDIKEGGFAHFEARLEPMGDHTMKVEWMKDGKPVEASSRITSFFNFGYVALTIKQVAHHDQGTYACTASNSCGRAETKACMRGVVRADPEFQAKNWESIQKMETKKVETSMQVQQEVTSAPKFVSALKGTNVVLEGQRAHFECRVEPQNDPSMKVQWYFNGQALSASSRIQTFQDFGYVAIDISSAKQEDSGTYTLVATNILGSEKAEVTLNVNAHAQVDYSTLHSSAVQETARFETKQEIKQEFEEVTATGPPIFKTTLVSPEPVSEGKNIHLEARLEPIGDPSMKVEWYFNGRPLTIGSRFKTYNDFGFIALDILGVTALDQGQYTCRATNRLGEAATNANVQVVARSNIVTETEHESAMQQISYLETEKVKLVAEEEVLKVAPNFTKSLKNVETGEGQNIHLEARISPTGDSSMRIEWTVNGKPLNIGHRFRPAHDFDYVALDLLSVYPEDSGVYTCLARNAYGEAQSSATIKVIGQQQVISESKTDMKQYSYLEQKSSTRIESQEETTSQVPVFTSSPKSIEVAEGQKAHFEARIIPVSDPTMRIEWFLNNQPIKLGSRFREGHDFGFVSLDISHVLPEDAGQYSCKASNSLGQAICSCTLNIKANLSIQKETLHESALQQINYLESSRTASNQEEDSAAQAPVFTASMRDTQVMENTAAHFEAKLVPIGDAKLKVEWLKDGRPIEASNRMSTLHDFGFVALDLKYTRPSDSGRYSIRAYNALGEATVSANLKVVSAQGGADMETMHGEALEKIAYLERNKARMELNDDETAQTAPNFVAKLQGKTQLLEGQNGHLECRIEPYPDSSLRVEWLHNGKALPFGNRWRTTYDFGFASLDILSCYAEDSGTYTAKAVNRLGSAESSINISVASGKGLLLESEHQEALGKIKYLESKHQKTAEEELAAPEAPQFGRPLKNVNLEEGQPAHFETTLTPVNDASMRVEWMFNGKPVPQGHRFRTTYDFGFVALDILYAYPEDSGTYTCVAKNVLGTTQAQCELQVQGKSGLLLDTMDRDRLNQLRNLEQRERHAKDEVDAPITKPVFTTPLNCVDAAAEGAHVHLECRLEPVNDPNLTVEWFVNSKAIKIGSRFRTTHDFGYVALDILGAYSEDSGTYMCKATNMLGEAVNTGSVTISAKKNLLLDSQHPEGWEKMRELESRRRADRLQVEEPEISAPKFNTQLQGVTSLSEGQTAHFEAQIQPLHDPSLRVEFLHNGRALQQASRIHTVCDFGYVALDIRQLISSDSGEYVCRAFNSLGECRSSINLTISARGSLDTSSQRPEGMDKIRELEARGPRTRDEEIQTFQKPVFTTALQNVVMEENRSAHLVARLIPVGDPSLKVEWLKDGKILETGSRIKTSLDFGLVTLDLDSVRASDVGIYTCKAVNLNGEATSTTSIKVQDDRSVGVEGDKEIGPPKFVSQVASSIEISEGQSAHFEARLTPAEDPNMKVEWFKDGKLLPTGHRFRTFHDFGIVILDIMYCYGEDSATYECRATNALGSDSTRGTVSCSEKSGLILTPQVPGEMKEQTLQQIQHLESHKMKLSADGQSVSASAPRFTSPLSNIADLKEGENAHFEARLLPTDDANMSVEWFWNGKALKAGSRIRTFCDFGFVILEISPVYPEDAGEYTCRAKNALGEAVTSATLSCSGKRNIILDSQLPSGMEGAMDRIAALEGLGRARGENQTEEDLNQPPEFLSTLSDLLLGENSLAHLETRLTPINDPSMKVEWFHNGKQLSAGSRIKTINDFGFVILEVANVMTRDTGNYTCKAINKHGEASISCQVQVKGKQGIDTGPQLPKSFQNGTESIHNLEERMWKREDITSDEMEAKAPVFVTTPHNVTCYEGQPAHFDCRIEPIGDGSMRVDWYQDGKSIQIGSRIHTINDFGFVVLDIDWTFKRDSGEYKCIATNKCGSAEVTVHLTCKSKKDIIVDSQLPQGMSTDRLKELEAKKYKASQEEETEITVPKFITQIQSRAVAEGEPAHFECRVDPKNDPKLQIKWYHNGKEIDFGHRFRLTFEFGYVALDILYTYPEDEGEYVCKAFNELGEDITRAELRCKELPAIQLENQVPKGMKKSEYLVQMEATMKKYTTEIFLTEDDVYDSEKQQPPRFVTQIQSITTLEEMQATKFECQLAPVGDPNMKVEWFFNGKPLSFKTRFTPIYDFGYVAMNFGWVYPEDSGEYICRATNLYGSDETRAIIKCSGKTGIVYESQLPKGMMSIERIREMESGWQRAPELLETETEKFKPCFVTKPEAVATTEGGSARFCCRVTGYPKPRVMWLINGHTVINGSRHKLIYDGMWHLDIPKCQGRDNGKIEVIARNQCGEAYASTSLTIDRRSDDFRGVLKHNVKRDFINSDDYRKPEWVTKMEELKERLANTEQAPKFVREIKEARIKEGMRARFDAGFAGFPKPEVTWYYQGQLLQNSSKVQIKVRDDSSTLTLIDCGFDSAGIYEVQAVNALGSDKCRASLTVNKMTEDEKVEYEKLKSAGIADLVADEEEKVIEKKKIKEERKEKVPKK